MKKNSEAAIKIALEQTYEGLQILDRTWRYIYVNEAVAKHGRKTKEELLGRTIMECYPGIESTQVYKELVHVMTTGTPRCVENEFVYSDGGKCWFELFIEPWTDGILIRSIDITARKDMESQLRHSQKMEAIGRLAGEVAHDFNNKLAIMLAYCEKAKSQLNGTNDLAESYVDKIMSAVEMSSVLTRRLLAFGRKQVLDLKLTDLNTLFSDSSDGLARILGPKILINYELAQDLHPVYVDPSQIDQVILNLCINARDSMSRGGELLIETANVDLDENYARSHPGVLPGAHVMMSFTDTGCGMDQFTQERIFEPYFTTKEKGKGTGLGLPSVHGIISQSRGHISVKSQVNRGSVFKIYLPAIVGKKSDTPSSSKEAPLNSERTGS